MKSQMTVVFRKDITQDQALALKDILESPNFLKFMKAELIERLETVMDGDGYVESIELELLEESK